MRDNPCNSTEVSTETSTAQTAEADDEQNTLSELEHCLSDNDQWRTELDLEQIGQTRDAVRLIDVLRILIGETSFRKITFREENEILQVMVESSGEVDLEPIRESIQAIVIDEEEYSYEIVSEMFLWRWDNTFKIYREENLREMSEDTLKKQMNEAKKWIKTEKSIKPM